MKLYDYFAFNKKVLTAAKKAGWEHQPHRDRYICENVTFSFSRFSDGKEIAVLDIIFDVCAMDVVKSAVAQWETKDGTRELLAQSVPFVDVDKLFDPKNYVAYGYFKE